MVKSDALIAAFEQVEAAGINAVKGDRVLWQQVLEHLIVQHAMRAARNCSRDEAAFILDSIHRHSCQLLDGFADLAGWDESRQRRKAV